MSASEQLLKTFKSFINDINDVIPTSDNEFINYYDEIMNLQELNLEDNLLINNFMNKISEYNEYIINENEEIFKKDLLENIDLMDIISIDSNDYIKSNLWKYLQTFSLISLNLNSSKELQILLSGEKIKSRKKDISDLKSMKKLKKNIIKNEENINKFKTPIKEDSNEVGDLGFEGIHNIIENTTLGTIAKDIASSINSEELFGNINSSNPDEIMQNLLDENNIMNMFNKITGVVQEKLESSEIDQSDMENEVKSLFPDIENNPIIKKMKENIDKNDLK